MEPRVGVEGVGEVAEKPGRGKSKQPFFARLRVSRCHLMQIAKHPDSNQLEKEDLVSRKAGSSGVWQALGLVK